MVRKFGVGIDLKMVMLLLTTDFTGRNLALVRADVARLPFATGTVDAVHAGAALHCWPSPLSGVRFD